MPMFTKVIAGLALGAAVAGGALAAGVTAANASAIPASDWRDGHDRHDKNRPVEHDDSNWWNNNRDWQRDNNGWWGQNFWKFDKTDHSAFGIAAKDVAVGFQDKTDKDDWYNNQNWWNRNDNQNLKDDNWWNKDERNHH
ncbi:hypothetical protein JOL79_27970 [Microbispora sp. RL4-1S]|uniref:BcpO-related WXXGXW repeat protein n=1 Tax=Microbispora oryzae TaxID=2806554 RepID=A0A940WUG6_9ACTN|nr:hypothetical protein [Microbispora oryzae]MBP2707625.1 hypothetical protein [Microbispora oryzae]